MLGRILQGCGGNVVQAIECVLENQSPIMDAPSIPGILPPEVPTHPHVFYSGYSPKGRMFHKADSVSVYSEATMYGYFPPLGPSTPRSKPHQALTMAPYDFKTDLKNNKTTNIVDSGDTASREEEKNTYCTNCGHKIQQSNRFCGGCGKRIA